MRSGHKQPNASAELMPDTSTTAPWSATRALMTATPDLAVQIHSGHLLTAQNTPFGAAQAVLLPGLADAHSGGYARGLENRPVTLGNVGVISG